MNNAEEQTPPPAAPSSSAETTRLYTDLRNLIEACGPQANKHDLATVLIKACIEEGRNTNSFIIGTLKNLRFNTRHVAKILKDGTGSNPADHHWQRDDHGRYVVHEDEREAGRSIGAPSPQL